MYNNREPKYKNADKNHPYPYFRYNLYSICMTPTDKYPHMVQIHRGPKVGRSIIGKKYLNHFFAIKAIDEFKTEMMIDKQLSSVVSTLESEGFDADAVLDAVNSDFTNF